MGSDAALALKRALRLEQEGEAFYREAAERTVDPNGKAMYASLAEDEVLHARIIEREMDALSEGKGWQATESAEGEVDLESPLFPQGKVAFEEAVRSDASDLDAILFALKIESDSFSLYAEQAKAATDAKAKQFYEFLAGAERVHFDLLMANYESLSQASGFI
jgi:rubrerythrin